MKNLIVIILMFFALSMTAQRDSLNYTTIFDSDTATWTKVGSDSIITFTYTLNSVTYTEKYSYDAADIMMDSLDSLIVLYQLYVEQKKNFVEHFYKEYKDHNSYLWNIQRQLARLEEVYDLLYGTP